MLPKYIASFITVALLAGGGYYYTEITSSSTTKHTTSKLSAGQTKVPTQNAPKKVVPSHTTPKETESYMERRASINILQPTFAFKSNLDSELVIYHNALVLAALEKSKPKVSPKNVKKKKRTKPKKVSKKKVVKKPLPKKKTVKKKPVVPKKVKVPVAPVVATAKEPIILGEKSTVHNNNSKKALVKAQSTSDDELKSVVKRFNRSKKPALGLFLANKYYAKGNYKESYKYAKATYKLNPKIEDAVILYAKSLAKLGHKDKAIAKLNMYIKKTHSIAAKALLNDLNKGYFK